MRLAEQNSASGAGWKGDPGLCGGGGCGFSFCLRAKAKVEDVCGRGPEHWGSAGWSLGVLAPGVCVCVGPALGGSGWWLVWLQKAREQMWVSLSSFCITHCIKMAFARDYLVGFVPSCLGGLSFEIWGSEGTQGSLDLHGWEAGREGSQKPLTWADGNFQLQAYPCPTCGASRNPGSLSTPFQTPSRGGSYKTK